MPITRDEVAHLARLSRLALTDDELDHFAAQLDVIIACGRAGPGGRRRGHPADLARGAADQRVPRRRAWPVPDAASEALAGARRRGAAVPGPADPGGGLSIDGTAPA